MQRGYISIITANGEYYHGDSMRLTEKILRNVSSPKVFTSTKVKHSDPGKSIYDHSFVLEVIQHSTCMSAPLPGEG